MYRETLSETELGRRNDLIRKVKVEKVFSEGLLETLFQEHLGARRKLSVQK